MYSLSSEICTDSKIYNPGNSKNLDKLRKILDLINAYRNWVDDDNRKQWSSDFVSLHIDIRKQFYDVKLKHIVTDFK